MDTEKKIALIIDCDNAKADAIYGIMEELSKFGGASIRRAYGNWKGKITRDSLFFASRRNNNQNLKYVSGGTPKTWDSFAAIFLDTGRRSCSIAERFCMEIPSFCARTF